MTSFERFLDRRFFHTNGSKAEIVETASAVTSGKKALRVTLLPGDNYPGINTSPLRGLPRDWSGSDRLSIDFFNPGQSAIQIFVRIDDAESKGYATRYNSSGWGMRPGKSTLSIPFRDLKTEDKSRMLDLSRIKALYFFTEKVFQPVEFYLDSLRLEKEQVMQIGGPGQYWFDFGPPDSPLWPGFTAVPPKQQFDEAQGYGFLSTESLYSENLGVPDPLAQDCVTGNVWRPYAYEFAVRVPNGHYGIRLISRHVSEAKLPIRSGTITAEGREVFHREITPEVFYSEAILYRGLGRPYRLNQDAWAKFFSPELDWKAFEVEVRDGRLNLGFTNQAIFALVVFPLTEEAKVSEGLAALDRQRRKHFHDQVYFEQTQEPSRYKATEAEIARGFAFRPVAPRQTVRPWSRPVDLPSGDKVRLLVVRGEYEPVTLAVTPLRDLDAFEVQIPGATNTSGGLIPSDAFEIRLVQYHEKRIAKGVYAPAESFMIPVTGPVDLHAGLTQRFWITLHVSDNAEAGRYRTEIALSSGEGTKATLPLEIEVLPLDLPQDCSLSLAWYYQSPGEFNYHFDRAAGVPKRRAEMLEREMRDMKAHGCTTFQFPGPKIDRVSDKGEIEFDFTLWNEYAQTARAVGLGLEHPPQTFMINIANALGKKGLKEGTEVFAIAYRNAVAQLAKWSQENEFPLVFWIVDEPREQLKNSWNRSLDETRFLLHAIQDLPGVQTTVTPMADKNGGVNYLALADEVDILQTHPWSDSAGLIDRAQKRGIPTWNYNAGVDRLSFGFHPWATGAQGRWQWHYAFWNDPYNVFEVGWGVTFPSPDGPLPTPQYERSREGAEDLRWLEALEAKLAAHPYHPAAGEARRLLESIRSEIPTYLDDALKTGEEAGDGYQGDLNARLPLWREQILRVLLKFEG